MLVGVSASKDASPDAAVPPRVKAVIDPDASTDVTVIVRSCSISLPPRPLPSSVIVSLGAYPEPGFPIVAEYVGDVDVFTFGIKLV